MRIFVAGGTGVIGIRLLPLFVADGHEVAALSRSSAQEAHVAGLGADPVVCDVFDAQRLTEAVVAFRPDLVMHQLTDLPDDPSKLAAGATSNIRIRREGTANLIAAARAAGCQKMIAQSVAWPLPGEGGAATEALERAVLDYGGVVLRYGQFFGPGTYHPITPPAPPRIHIDEAACRTIRLLEAPRGVVDIVDDAE
ncbi:MAG: NAD-dependent epimerase/dehydratase family protein [Acidimicrobiales bacterium]